MQEEGEGIQRGGRVVVAYSSHSLMGSKFCTGMAEMIAGWRVKSLNTNTKSKFFNENYISCICIYIYVCVRMELHRHRNK